MHDRSFRYGPLAHAISGILCATGALTALPAVYAQETETSAGEPSGVDVVTVTADPLRALGSGPSESSMGFAKTLLETPRAVSFVSEEQINAFGISTVEDLTRLVPGTYTTTRYGLQGGVHVRGVPSDMYYRGMKRLQMQGHVRTVLSAMDGIEVIKGPPSPIYGMGRIGGYQNLIPKSSRASTGAYMSDMAGFIQTTQGSYDRNEIQGGFGGPFRPAGKEGGYYLFGLFEDSDTYVKHVGARQEFFQATVAIEDVIGPFRMEFGGQAQESITSGAYMNRADQRLVDTGMYLRGVPLVNLDTNGDGMVGYVESYQNSPVVGTISSTNQSLLQRFPWPTDASGAFVSVDQFPTVPGIPQTLLDYLNAHPEIDCRAADVMRSMPVGGPVPLSGQLPVGFALDPCSVGFEPVDWRGNGAYEREQNADQRLAYVDFIADQNPDFTMKLQMMYDSINSFKDSWLPYGENQYVKATESKFTITKRISDDHLPGWLRINSLYSVNYRLTEGWLRSSGGDFDWRQDIMLNNGVHYPNTKFWTQLTNPDYATGAPNSRFYSSRHDSKGLGIMFDIDLGANTNIVLGGRYDTSDARATNMPAFIETAGVSPAPGVECLEPGAGCPGAWAGPAQTVEGTDSGSSWSFSISRQIGAAWRPYFTIANSSLQLTGSNDLLQTSVVRAGHVGEAELKEIGVKAAFFEDKLQWTTAAYEQTRTDVANPDDPTESADVSTSIARGIETEIRWVPNANLFLSAYFLSQHSDLLFDTGANISLSPRQLGFEDVVDPQTGEVLYPAEAFMYGGGLWSALALPANYPGFRKRPGNPDQQAGITGSYTFDNGLGITFGVQWFSEVWADRIMSLLLPEALVLNAGLTFDRGPWNLRVNGYNVNDERYFRSGRAAGVMSVMPGTRWELTAKHAFNGGGTR